jgi:hypothetical protein
MSSSRASDVDLNMSQRTKKLEPSLVHLLFDVAPGTAPEWMRPGNCPEDENKLTIFLLPLCVVVLLGAACIALHFWLGLIPVAVLFWTVVRIESEIDTCERKARARIRRGECIWCGAKGVPGGTCEGCRDSIT